MLDIYSVEALRLEDDFYHDPSMCYLVAANSRSPRDSSRTSLMHSNSGSTDISDSMPPAPAATPSSLCHARSAISLEFGDHGRAFSLGSDEGSPDQLHRGRAFGGICRHPSSPKLERRAFLMKSSSSTGPGSPVSSNMLTVCHPYQFADSREVQSFDDSVPPMSLAVPTPQMFGDGRGGYSEHNRSPHRSMPVLAVGGPANKPPLVKTKNISHANSTSALGDNYSSRRPESKPMLADMEFCTGEKNTDSIPSKSER